MSYSCGVPIETTVNTSDQLSLYSTTQGQPRRASVSALAAAVNSVYPTPDAVLDIGYTYGMRGQTGGVVALTTSYQTLTAYSASQSFPTTGASFVVDTATGTLTAVRDITRAQIWIALQGVWPTNRDLDLVVRVGPTATPYETDYKAVIAGGGAAVRTASFSGVIANLNNVFGTIKAGEKITLDARFNTADNITINRLSILVMPLDGV
jgi:hypothetical protein